MCNKPNITQRIAQSDFVATAKIVKVTPNEIDTIYDNVEIEIIEIYKGKSNEFSQSVALNVAAGLIVSGKESEFKPAFDKATKHLKSGKVFHHLIKIQSS